MDFPPTGALPPDHHRPSQGRSRQPDNLRYCEASLAREDAAPANLVEPQRQSVFRASRFDPAVKWLELRIPPPVVALIFAGPMAVCAQALPMLSVLIPPHRVLAFAVALLGLGIDVVAV